MKAGVWLGVMLDLRMLQSCRRLEISSSESEERLFGVPASFSSTTVSDMFIRKLCTQEDVQGVVFVGINLETFLVS